MVKNAKRTAVFQTTLKLIREEAGAQIPSNDNKCSTSQRSKGFPEEGHYKYKRCINLEMIGSFKNLLKTVRFQRS